MEDTMSLIHLANEVNYGKIYLKAKDSSDQKKQIAHSCKQVVFAAGVQKNSKHLQNT